jgi:ATP-dependent Clp protease protease subunit
MQYRLEDDEEQDVKKLLDKVAGDQMLKKRFLEQRKIFLWGPVHDESAKHIVDRLLYLDQEKPGEEIKLYINSPGGVVTSGFIIYDTINMISSPVATICMGMAASMGAVLLSAGAKGKRQIFPTAEVMIHQPSLGGTIQGRVTDLEIHAKQIAKAKEISAQILAENCGQPIERIRKDFDRDYWMGAKEAVEYGIVDSIAEKVDA